MANVIVALKNITVKINNNIILQDINFDIHEHEFLGIIGPNGGGKTTLLKTILGLIKPSRGEIRIFGETIEKSRAKIGYVPQMHFLDIDFPISVLDVVAMGRISKKGLFKKFSDEDYLIINDALEKTGIARLKHKAIGSLSGGERQRVFIARALVSQPKLLLLDEPTASIDPKTKLNLYELLNTLKQEMSIVLVSHDMGVINKYVENIACLNVKLFAHNTKEISAKTLAQMYQCPVDIIAHGVPHRVFEEHEGQEIKD